MDGNSNRTGDGGKEGNGHWQGNGDEEGHSCHLAVYDKMAAKKPTVPVAKPAGAAKKPAAKQAGAPNSKKSGVAK